MKKRKLKKGEVEFAHFDGNTFTSGVIESPNGAINILLMRMDESELAECLRNIAAQYGMTLPENIEPNSPDRTESGRALGYVNNASRELLEIAVKAERGGIGAEESEILSEIAKILQRYQELRTKQAELLWEQGGKPPTRH